MPDCWMNNKRSSKGYLIADSKRFPSGIPKLAENLHSLGFQFGIYESAGQITCQGLPGSIRNYPYCAYVDLWRDDNDGRT